MSHLRTLWACLCLTSILSCASQITNNPVARVSSEGARENGAIQIHQIGNEHPLSWSELVVRLGEYDFVLVGEEHDNVNHHRIERALVENVSSDSSKSRLVFEMLATDQIDEEGIEPALRGAKLRDFLRWEQGGWDWTSYGPTIESGLEHGFDLRAGNIPRSELYRWMQAEVALPELDRLDEAARQALLDELEKGHCGMVPREKLFPMLRIQVARDSSMQEALGAPDGETHMLITGRFHARRDLGVPVHIFAKYPEAKVASIALVGIDKDDERADVLKAFGARHDFVVLTASAEPRGDPCEKLRQMYKSKPD